MHIKAGKDTPSIYLSMDAYKIEIKGECYALKIKEIFQPVFNWIDTELIKLNNEMIWMFEINSINSESTRIIVELINKLNRYHDDGIKSKIIWKYDNCNDHIYDKGVDFSEISLNRFELFQINNC
jgi:hypothetical protein